MEHTYIWWVCRMKHTYIWWVSRKEEVPSLGPGDGKIETFIVDNIFSCFDWEEGEKLDNGKRKRSEESPYQGMSADALARILHLASDIQPDAMKMILINGWLKCNAPGSSTADDGSCPRVLLEDHGGLSPLPCADFFPWTSSIQIDSCLILIHTLLHWFESWREPCLMAHWISEGTWILPGHSIAACKSTEHAMSEMYHICYNTVYHMDTTIVWAVKDVTASWIYVSAICSLRWVNHDES